MEELALADKYPHVRTFMVGLNTSEAELRDLIKVELPWSVVTAGECAPPPSGSLWSAVRFHRAARLFPGGLFDFSAVCWLFGRYMYDELQYPVGLVESCWGGTPVEAWSSPRALRRCGLEPTDTR